MSGDFEVELKVLSIAESSATGIRGKSLVVLQVNCTSVYNTSSEFWNLVDMYNPDVVIAT
jgi:hypothetical protein